MAGLSCLRICVPNNDQSREPFSRARKADYPDHRQKTRDEKRHEQHRQPDQYGGGDCNHHKAGRGDQKNLYQIKGKDIAEHTERQ